MTFSINLTAEEFLLFEKYAKSWNLSLEDAFKEAFFEKIEDHYNLAIAEEAYAEYVKAGCKSRPIEEFWKELDLD